MNPILGKLTILQMSGLEKDSFVSTDQKNSAFMAQPRRYRVKLFYSMR